MSITIIASPFPDRDKCYMATGGTGNIPLHPPSFFEALYSKEEGERSEAIHGVREELRQLWQENKELK